MTVKAAQWYSETHDRAVFFTLTYPFTARVDGAPQMTSLIACGKFGSPYPGKATAAARAALPIPNSACGVFVYPNKGMAANAWDL